MWLPFRFSVSMRKLPVFYFLMASSAPTYIRQANEISEKEKKSYLLSKKNMPYLQHGVKPNRCICSTSEEEIPVIRWTVNWKHRPKVRREGKSYRGTQRNGAPNICKRTKDSVKEIVQFYLVVHERGRKINHLTVPCAARSLRHDCKPNSFRSALNHSMRDWSLVSLLWGRGLGLGVVGVWLCYVIPRVAL